MTRVQADMGPIAAESDYNLETAMRDLRTSGVSVESAQIAANNKVDQGLEGLNDEPVNIGQVLSAIEGRGDQPAFNSAAQELVIGSMLPAIRERLIREGQFVSPARLEEITKDVIRTELLAMDSQRNEAGERDWNINLGELNEYRVEHGLSPFRTAAEHQLIESRLIER